MRHSTCHPEHDYRIRSCLELLEFGSENARRPRAERAERGRGRGLQKIAAGMEGHGLLDDLEFRQHQHCPEGVFDGLTRWCASEHFESERSLALRRRASERVQVKSLDPA